jgi:hypothetical protein
MDVAIQTATGRLHWVMAEACQQSSVMCNLASNKIIMETLDDDVAEVVTTFLNYNYLHPVILHIPIMHGKNSPPLLPAWTVTLQATMAKDKRFARDVLVQAEPFQLHVLQCLAANCI